MALGCELLSTIIYCADKRLLSRMDPKMSLQISFFCKCLVTTCSRTPERLLSCLSRGLRCCSYMGPSMNLESPRTTVAFTAWLTDKRLVPWVNQFVSFQMTLGNELLITPFKTAYEWPFTCLNTLTKVISHVFSDGFLSFQSLWTPSSN